MLLACWSPKGGVGTTVVAAALGLVLARSSGACLLVDTAGDLPVVLGAGSPPAAAADVGLAEWLVAAPDVPADALGRIEEPVADGLHLLRRGGGPMVAGAGAELLARLLCGDPRAVVADCGRIDPHDDPRSAGRVLAGVADRSLLVLRPCVVALRRALLAPVRPHGVVLVDEPGRSLRSDDVESTLGVPLLGRIRVTEQIARAVDAGLLAVRLPRTLTADLRHVA